MKLELLLVLAVSALGPSLSESRIVTRCELKNKLGAVIPLNQKFQRNKDVILAGIICEVEKLTNLNTSLVIVNGIRQPKTTAQPATTVAATGGTVGPAAVTTTSSPAATAAITTAGGFNTSGPVPTNSSAPAGSFRRKREASNMNHNSEETQNDDSGEMEEDNEHKGGKDGNSENKIPVGKYGLFQLTDKSFCDSGYLLSKNKCKTDCSAFTDDDITDDIDCFIKTGYWEDFLDDISDYCVRQQRQAKTFFSGCS